MTDDTILLPELPEWEPGAPPPHPLKEATPAEQAQAVADQKARPSPRRYSNKGETWAKKRLQSLGAVFSPKNSDVLRTYIDKQGNEKVFYQRRGVDYEGVFPGSPAIPFVLEVKTFCGHFNMASLGARQQRILSKERAQGKLAMICLVDRDKEGKILRGWFIPWRGPGEKADKALSGFVLVDWEDMRQSLMVISEHDKRFKGRSIRKKDFYVLRPCKVRKIRGRWKMCAWLIELVALLKSPVPF
ncbi:MAG: hypothetical protein DRQ02_01310 [Candidatus Latescibacterota bacterium]|nr:MAG: hypothetical protein DRQ02_01310 [Candidatus Latescibacterota bacterium]